MDIVAPSEDREAMEKRLGLFLKGNFDMFEEILNFKEQDKNSSSNQFGLMIPLPVLDTSKGVTVDFSSCYQMDRAVSYISLKVKLIGKIKNLSYKKQNSTNSQIPI